MSLTTQTMRFFAAGVAGFLTVSLWPKAPPEVDIAPTPIGEPVMASPSQDCPTEGPNFNAIGALQAELEAKRQGLAVARAQEELATGKPLEWPGKLPSGLDEASVEAAFQEIAEAHGGTVLGMDCGEYPCVAVMAWRGENFEHKGAAHAEVWDTWPGAVSGSDTLWTASGGVDGHAFALGFTPEGELTEAELARIRFRAGEALQIFNAEGHIYPDGMPEPVESE